MLQGAIDRGHQLEISYYVPSRDEQSSPVVDPRGLTRVGDATYLDAWCHTANGDRAFRVDRIVAATELPDSRSPTAPRSPATCPAAGSAVTARPWP